MAQVTMEAHGRFGQMLAAAVSRERLSLRDLAAKLDYTYEQMRKLWTGRSAPSPLLLKEICRILHLDFDKAQEAANADRAERKFGATALTMQGRDPRLADIEELLPQLSEQEWDMFVAQMRGFVHQKRQS
jgi:transcriptional regulator with XRE-family HTH domain